MFNINNSSCSLIGVVHVDALPGAAGYNGDMNGIVEKAVAESEIYKAGGMEAIIIENMHDAPYLKGHVEPESTAAMAVLGKAVKEATRLPVGMQILAGANLDALGAAIAGGLDFIRVEGFV
ncbi:MAG TPA: BtpA/SgcQ family protein, partial [Chroococcales cyanobacterium]